MILYLLAALFGAAQEAIVVYEGAETDHFVANHPGNNYEWRVFTGLNPDLEAPPDDYELTVLSPSSSVKVKWIQIGLYYIRVVETDPGGCTNLKVLPVKVVAGKRSVSFVANASSSCFNKKDNGFDIPLQLTGNGGNPLEESFFPVLVEFMVDGVTFDQTVEFEKQSIEIPGEIINISPQLTSKKTIQLIGASDILGNSVELISGKDFHVRTVYAVPETNFVSFSDLVQQGTEVIHEVELTSGNSMNAIYNWSVEPPEATSSDLATIKDSIAAILWDGPEGIYTLKVHVVDGYGCISDTLNQLIEIEKSDPATFEVYAGDDTTIGSCQSYVFNNVFPTGDSYTYLWSPAIYLSNPNIPNPVFTPGETTTYVLTVSTLTGVSVSDTIKISVAELKANAGDDIFMLPGTNTILNGSASVGENLNFMWTTNNGQIESGDNTANPVVSRFGEYFLEITDKYGCTKYDTVNVILMVQAPVANDDYDTTYFRTETIIPVLANDTDSQNSLNPASLKITTSPANGTAYVDFDNFNIHYRPSEGFNGNDMFEYEVCNTTNLCDKANVYVLVTEYLVRIPNAFTPNGDGINDFFEIIGIENYPGNSIKIINRWGNKVYEANNYGIETYPVYWDGKANTGSTFLGNELPTGTYYYLLDLGNGQKPIAGSIYLDR
jgi:gliding motility-associated-like protein